ncbi:MAG: FAD-dependent oxidoreductase [Phycisphaerales bacterium]
MHRETPLELDAVIFGGGATGLWLLDALRRRGDRAVLLEAGDLGSGQTVASQGIIHGGLKYSLRGMLTASARAIRDMPGRWRGSLAGETSPDLRHTRLRSSSCWLWQTNQLRSRMAMLGALRGLAVTARTVEDHERPACLKDCPGTVARLDEQVIEPASFIADLFAQYSDAILAVDARGGIEIDQTASGTPLVRLLNPSNGEPLDLAPGRVVLCAGGGNAALRALFNLTTDAMQRRPLHMVVARGDLPVLNGHCVDGMKTRITITSTTDHANRVIWQLGGQVAEDGVGLEPSVQIERARDELAAVLPGFDLSRVEFGTYRVDRAEAAGGRGQRPGDAVFLEDGPVITAWPTKLALVPRLVDELIARFPAPPAADPDGAARRTLLARWPRPPVAAAPWDEEATWINDHSAAPASK